MNKEKKVKFLVNFLMDYLEVGEDEVDADGIYDFLEKNENDFSKKNENIDFFPLNAIINPHWDSKHRLDGGVSIVNGEIIGHIDPIGEEGTKGCVGCTGSNDNSGELKQ